MDPLQWIVEHVAASGLSLYPHQEEALLEIAAGANVIVNTPTGSGKSLIALGAHVAAISAGGRSFYTAPIKALVSEKFFDLCRRLGHERVGLMTGDGTVNAGAPVICCTAEILANMALRGGAATPVDQVVMDEFHYYADPTRGWAWQVPLLELRRAQFVLMSATLGDVTRFQHDLTRRTGRPTAVIQSVMRPVPLDFEYARTPVHRTIEELLASAKAPVYVVHATQASAIERAQSLMSVNVSTRAEKDALALAIGDFRFAPGFGRTLSRYVRSGVGVHHAGMLPKYRRLVERLSQDGLLKVICGTDTLGVGINVPIRTVLLTQLSKFDGSTSRLLTAREFHQITGRAGRAGFDTAGTVVAQAPEHEIDNAVALAKAGDDPKKRRKVVRSQPPRGYVPWSEDTFHRLIASPPEPLVSSFGVSHSMLLNVLDRPDGCTDFRRLMVDNDEPRVRQRQHIRRAISIYRSLLSVGVLDPNGGVTVDLQQDFALNQPLSPLILEAIPLLQQASEAYALDLLSIVESTLDNPGPVLAAQLDKLKTETMTRLKSEGVEYTERIAILEKLEPPKPLREFTYDLFDRYRIVHPWAADHNIAPKSVVRDMYERAMGFGDYVGHYGIARSEGLLLRYLSDAYKAMVQAVPEDAKDEEVFDLTEWLGTLVRQVDSSLLDEWEALQHPGDEPPAAPAPPPALSANTRAFRVMVRNAMWRMVDLIARRDWAGLDGIGGWPPSTWSSALAPYYEAHDAVLSGADARGPGWFQVAEGPGRWEVRQVLVDPAGDCDWSIRAAVDLVASDGEGEPVVQVTSISPG